MRVCVPDRVTVCDCWALSPTPTVRWNAFHCSLLFFFMLLRLHEHPGGTAGREYWNPIAFSVCVYTCLLMAFVCVHVACIAAWFFYQKLKDGCRQAFSIQHSCHKAFTLLLWSLQDERCHSHLSSVCGCVLYSENGRIIKQRQRERYLRFTVVKPQYSFFNSGNTCNASAQIACWLSYWRSLNCLSHYLISCSIRLHD